MQEADDHFAKASINTAQKKVMVNQKYLYLEIIHTLIYIRCTDTIRRGTDNQTERGRERKREKGREGKTSSAQSCPILRDCLDP